MPSCFTITAPTATRSRRSRKPWPPFQVLRQLWSSRGRTNTGPAGRQTISSGTRIFVSTGILETCTASLSVGKAHSVLQSDIDELVLTEDGVSVFDPVSWSATGHIRFDGRWIESAKPLYNTPILRAAGTETIVTSTRRSPITPRSLNGPCNRGAVHRQGSGAFTGSQV